MKLPKVPRYSQHISQVCLRVKITACSAMPAWVSGRSSMPNQAAAVLARISGTQMKPCVLQPHRPLSRLLRRPGEQTEDPRY